jgi:hypothetical protein
MLELLTEYYNPSQTAVCLGTTTEQRVYEHRYSGKVYPFRRQFYPLHPYRVNKPCDEYSAYYKHGMACDRYPVALVVCLSAARTEYLYERQYAQDKEDAPYYTVTFK